MECSTSLLLEETNTLRWKPIGWKKMLMQVCRCGEGIGIEKWLYQEIKWYLSGKYRFIRKSLIFIDQRIFPIVQANEFSWFKNRYHSELCPPYFKMIWTLTRYGRILILRNVLRFGSTEYKSVLGPKWIG